MIKLEELIDGVHTFLVPDVGLVELLDLHCDRAKDHSVGDRSHEEQRTRKRSLRIIHRVCVACNTHAWRQTRAIVRSVGAVLHRVHAYRSQPWSWLSA